MSSVNDGRRLYQQEKHGTPVDPDALYRACRGTVENGRLAYLAAHGDERAREVLRQRADRGDDAAADVLDGAGQDGMTVTAGTDPGSFTAANVG